MEMVICYIFDRWNISKQYQRRSIEDIVACTAANHKEPFSVKHPPLLQIDLDHVVPDELHMLLRVMDVLLENVIHHVVQLDIQATRKADPLQGPTLVKLVSLIQSCGVPFRIWSKDSIDRSKHLDWTSLGGDEKRKVLSKLPI